MDLIDTMMLKLELNLQKYYVRSKYCSFVSSSWNGQSVVEYQIWEENIQLKEVRRSRKRGNMTPNVREMKISLIQNQGVISMFHFYLFHRFI